MTGPGGDRGMATAELAVAMLAALAVFVTMCWGLTAAVTDIRCLDTAAAVARQAARADPVAVARAKAAAPRGATVRVQRSGERVRVVVELRLRPPGRWLPALPLRAQAEVAAEPGMRR